MRRSLPMLQAHVSDNLNDNPVEGMINCFGSIHSNPEMLKFDLQMEGKSVTKKNRSSTEKTLIYSQQVLFNKGKKSAGNAMVSVCLKGYT